MVILVELLISPLLTMSLLILLYSSALVHIDKIKYIIHKHDVELRQQKKTGSKFFWLHLPLIFYLDYSPHFRHKNYQDIAYNIFDKAMQKKELYYCLRN